MTAFLNCGRDFYCGQGAGSKTIMRRAMTLMIITANNSCRFAVERFEAEENFFVAIVGFNFPATEVEFNDAVGWKDG